MRPEKRRPYPRESVKIHSFWRRPQPIYHARWAAGTICDPDNLSNQHVGCGHALPIDLADKIARPCRKCYLPREGTPDDAP